MSNTKRIYKLPIHWTVMSELEVEATSLKEAKEIVDQMSLPTDATYMEGSFVFDERSMLERNNDLYILKEIEEELIRKDEEL